MKKRSILLGCVTMLTVASVMGAGCGNKDKGKETAGSGEAGTAAVTESQESTDGEEQGTEDGTGSTDEESVAETVEEPDFSAGLTEDGLFEDYTASDYVTLGTYKGIKVPAEEATVSDEDFEEYLDNLLADYIKTVDVTDRAVESGDTVNIDYVGSLDGVEFDGGTAEGYNLEIGSGTFIPGFEDQIIGHEIGE